MERYDEERKGEVEAELRSIHEAAGDNPLTEEQQKRWDELEAERAQLEEARAKLEARRETVRKLAAKQSNVISGDGATGGPQVIRQVTPFDGEDVRSLSTGQARDKALKALEDKELPNIDTTDQTKLAEFLPWSPTLPQDCHVPNKSK